MRNVKFTQKEWVELYPLYTHGIKATGDWVEGIQYIEEMLTDRQYNFLMGFAMWIVAGGVEDFYGQEMEVRAFGSGNYIQRFQEYKSGV